MAFSLNLLPASFAQVAIERQRDVPSPGRSAACNGALQTRDRYSFGIRKGPDQRCTAIALHRIRDTRSHITFFIRPQPLIADQMPRSSRKRSIGAEELMARMR